MPEGPLEEILSLFLERDEVAPGIVKVSLPLGEHRLGVQIRSLGGGLTLRAFVLDALPPDLARNALVREKITAFGDIVKSGRVYKDDAGRPYIESELGRGSTFVVELPASEQTPAATADAERVA